MLKENAPAAPRGWPPCPEHGEVFITVGRHQRQMRVGCECEKKAEEEKEAREKEAREWRERQSAISDCNRDYHQRGRPPKKYQGARLADVDDRPCSLAGKTAGLAFVGTWNERRPNGDGLILSGDIGTGKTMVAVAIANTIVSMAYSVRFTTVTDLQTKMRDWDAAGEAMRDFKRADCVVIDDLGQERVTEWASSVLFDLIDARYADKLPTIVTTNLGAKQLREHYIRSLTRGKDQMPADQAAITVDRILSRLRERNAHVLFEGPDQRAGTEHPWLDR